MFSTPTENSRTWKILKDPHTYTICGFFHMTVTALCGYQLDRHLWPVLLTNKAFANSEPTFLDKSRWICLSVFCLNDVFEFSIKLNPLSGRHLFWGGKFFGQISKSLRRLIKEIGQRGGDQHLRPTNQPTGAAVKPVTRSSPAFEINWDLLRPIFSSLTSYYAISSHLLITQQSNRSWFFLGKQTGATSDCWSSQGGESTQDPYL